MKFFGKRVDDDDDDEYKIELKNIQSKCHIKDILIITIIDTISNRIVDHVFKGLITSENEDECRFEKYATTGIWELVCFLAGKEDPSFKDIAQEYDGEVISVQGDTKYYSTPRSKLPKDKDFRLIIVTTYDKTK